MSKINKIFLILLLLVPILLFLNRFLVPDNSFDSINYHTFLGYRAWFPNSLEFFPTGIHNFSPIFDMINYPLIGLLGYRLGSIGSLFFLYGNFLFLYLICKLLIPGYKLSKSVVATFLLVNTIYSFEIFLQIATYYTDISVAFFVLVAIYYLLLFEDRKKLRYMLASNTFMAITMLGKFSSWYVLFPYLCYLIYILIKNTQFSWNTKISCLITSALISLSLIAPWAFRMYKITGNPVFPFYNSIFASPYFPQSNFKQVLFGGRNLIEKLTWGVASMRVPVRLGEVHDLFTDYKINIYFVSAILILFVGLYFRKITLIKFTVLYLSIFLAWSLSFGYLRYALILEMLGGLLLLLTYATINNKFIKIALLAIVLLNVVQDKRIVNLSLAYDLSFRKNYFYNRQEYLQEKKNLFVNKILIDKSYLDKYQPSVYLNCATPSTTYFVLSNVSNLPILNIETRAYGDLTRNYQYLSKANSNLKNIIFKENPATFVTIIGSGGLINTTDYCLSAIKEKNYSIDEIVDNFDMLGYSGQKLSIVFGKINSDL